MKTIAEILFDPALSLENDRVRLRMVKLDDLEQLKTIALDPSIWTWFTSEIRDETDMLASICDAMVDFSNKTRVPFVSIDKGTGRIVGMSSLGNISIADKRIEIGWSWLSTDVQGTGINQSYKSLLIDFVFERLHFTRLEFKTDVLNIKARKALLKIGSKEEGILRSHTQMHHNRRRDTIYYSILKEEWETSKNQL